MVQRCDSVGLSSYSHGGHQVNPQSVAFYGLQIARKQIVSISCGAYAVNPHPPTQAPSVPCDDTVFAVVHFHL